jgi:fatty acid desaturase
MEVSSEQSYKELEARMIAHDLFRRRYTYYLSFLVLLCTGVALSLFVIVATDNIWIQVINALFLSFVFVQASTLAHDCSHKQVFESAKANRWTGKVIFGFFNGLSETWWFAKHNVGHHAYPNQIGKDPDLGNPFSYSHKQLEEQSSFKRTFIKPYQHIIFFVFLFYVYFVFLFWSPRYAFSNRHKDGVYVELFCMTLHWLFFGFFIFYFLPLPTALLFAFINLMASSIYMRLIFAPNHKGEEMLGRDEQFLWTHQITTTRNIKPSWLVFHLTGGLNFQIEHHLFPSMPRPACWKARYLVKEYCERHAIPYHETSFSGSMIEIYQALKKVSAM